MILEPAVCGAHDGVPVDARVEDEHRMHALFGALRAASYDADDRRLAHAGKLVQHALDVFREHIEPLRRDDHFLLAALDEDAPLLVAFPDVTGVEPAVAVEHGLAAGIRDSRL